MSSERVLLIGSGGREHALALKLSASKCVERVFVSPGNGGTDGSEQNKVCNIKLDVKNFDAVLEWCKQNEVKLVVVGPEDPLANGIVDHLEENGIKCFGPSRLAARMEASKQYAKEFMNKYNIPTARWKSFSNANDACLHIESVDYKAYVIKMNGLAAGKGVYVTNSVQGAQDAVKILFKDVFGDLTVIVEELLEGKEISMLCFSDGESIKVMPPSQDHKRLNDDDEGPNTGGMGAYCPCSWVSNAELKFIEENILLKTVSSLKKEGIPYKGVLYAGLMMTKSGPKVLEFNCRFGDPETQVVLSLLESDLFSIMKCCVSGGLSLCSVRWHSNLSSVAVVLVSSGYPSSYPKGKKINGIEIYDYAKHIEVIHAGTLKTENDEFITNGGRVLAIVSTSSSLQKAVDIARNVAKSVQFEGKFFRNDIGKKGLARLNVAGGLTYASSGVSIAAGNDLVSSIKSIAAQTFVPGLMGSIGGFGGMFDLKSAGYDNDDTILVSGTDGVGTKLLIAQQCGKHDTIGIDLVAMCVNDVLAQGAQPLFFLDYFACGKLDVHVAESVIRGIGEGCLQSKCALIGGETAEMPGMYPENKYDLAGFCVGAVTKHQLLPKVDQIADGDVVIGIGSSGIHSNGFSLVRAILEKHAYSIEDKFEEIGNNSLGSYLLTPTKIYVHLLPLIRKCKAFVHVTGGGLVENIPRVLPPHLGAELNADAWHIPKIFQWMADKGQIEADEILKTFNCGLGGVIIIDKNENCDEWIKKINISGESAWKIGNICKLIHGQPTVQVKNIETKFKISDSWLKKSTQKNRKRVGVLISGSGTNLQALIDSSLKPNSSFEIVYVISNIADAYGLKRAQDAGIDTKVINHKEYGSRVDFDMVIHRCLIEENVEYVCLAGFMRILSADFVNKWSGHLINTHPSLLPSFRGIHAARQALQAGVSITGCTVHFVTEELDAGAIITQEAVPVLPGDDETSLQERIKLSEHVAFSRALQLLTSETICLSEDGKTEWKKV